MTDHDPDNWKKIWRTIDARRDALGLTWRELERRGRVSQRTLYKMRDDGTPLKTAPKRSSLARALGWSTDAFDRMERGSQPQDADFVDKTLDSLERAGLGTINLVEDLTERMSTVVARLKTRVDELDAQVRSQSQDIAYLLERARQDDADAPLVDVEPTDDVPRPGSAGV